MQPNILLLVLDSLRYDVAISTPTPNLDRLFLQAGAGTWRRCYATATYTLPAHISIFQGGILPSDPHSTEPVYNNRMGRAFRSGGALFGDRPSLFVVPETAASILGGFMMMGYNTLGVGGVGWFDRRQKTAKVWDKYFDHMAWHDSFREENPQAFEAQLSAAAALLAKSADAKKGWPPSPHPVFFFLNCPSTHTPYCGKGRTLEGQGQALYYVDTHLPTLIDLMPKPCHVFIMADHGDCFGEDGLWGHNLYHPKVMEVPMIHFRQEKEVVW